MEETDGQRSSFELSAGALCLDFANVLARTSDRRLELPGHYEELVTWAWRAGDLADIEAQRLIRAGRRSPMAAERTVARAVALCEAIFGLFSSVARREPAPPVYLATLNENLSRAFPNARVVLRGDERFALDWISHEEALERVLWPVTRSAVDLLVSETLNRVRVCADTRCGRLFVDSSRNRRRQWCDMRVCGNRAKARRHYARHKGSRGSDGG